MRKTLYIILFFILISISYFYYENYKFNNYIDIKAKSEMKILTNKNAPVKSKNQIVINAPLDVVWGILTDIANWPKWQKAVGETVINEEIKEGSEFEWKAGGLSFKSKIHTKKSKSMFGWTGTTFGASAIHNWIFEEKDNKTIVRVEESLQGVFPKLFSSYFQKNLDAAMMTNLRELKTASETKLQSIH